MNADKLAAYQTLYKCLVTVAKLMAPVSPFFADRLYRDLNRSDLVGAFGTVPGGGSCGDR